MEYPRDFTNKIIQGNALEVLEAFPTESIDCCITSPPYWGLRDYGTAKWEGGDDKCDHKGGILFHHILSPQLAGTDETNVI